MNILITGARGFIGKNLVATLESVRDGKDCTRNLPSELTIMPFDIDGSNATLEAYCAKADFVLHLAGVNRPKEATEYMDGNYGFTEKLLEILKKSDNRAPILATSSIQAALDNPYGKSKKAEEDCLLMYEKEHDIPVYLYRMPNVFGKWCRPNYNSAIATFCHNIARDLPITVNDPATPMRLVYIDDVVDEMIRALEGRAKRQGVFCAIQPEYCCQLGDVADLIRSFQETRRTKEVPNMGDELTRKLYATYLSYLPGDEFNYPLKVNTDERGSFTEILRTMEHGQVSVNISKPHMVKGNHWHHTKNEKFIVVSGKGVIRFRKIGEEKVYEYFVSGEKIESVDIPTGYTHNIENLGDTDMVTVMWASECFDPDKPDTYYQEV